MANAGYDIQVIIFIFKSFSIKQHLNLGSKLLVLENASSGNDEELVLHVENRLSLP